MFAKMIKMITRTRPERGAAIIPAHHRLRHAAGPPTANIYVVFRLEAISGKPTYDGHETIGAGYFSLEDMARMERVQALSIWAIDQALNTPVGSGFKPDPQSPAALIGPGRSLFGLAGLS